MPLPGRGMRVQSLWEKVAVLESLNLGLSTYPLERILQDIETKVGHVPWLFPRFPASCPFRVVHIGSFPGAVSGSCCA